MVFILVTSQSLFHNFKQDCFVSLILRFEQKSKGHSDREMTLWK